MPATQSPPANNANGHTQTVPPSSVEERREVLLTLARLGDNAETTILELIRSRKEAREAAHKAAEAAEGATAILEKLLLAPPQLARLESVRTDHTGRPVAMIRLFNQTRQVTIHPEVDIDELEELRPWDYVCIHPQENVVIGSWRDDDLFARCQGEIAEFRSYRDREKGLVVVARQGRDEEVIMLAPSMMEETLEAGNRLVLHRDWQGMAIARVPSDRIECPYEVKPDQITTQLEDLAGLEPVLEPLIQEVLLRLVYPEFRREFDLAPLQGMILYSYKPGMGKTSMMRGVYSWLRKLGNQKGFDIALFSVKPNEFKSMWHGEDARLVREFFGTLRARMMQPRDRRLLMMVLFDEIDSLGTRAGNQTQWVSSAHNDAVQAILAEVDGIVKLGNTSGPGAELLFVGLTNRPDMLDPALKRPGRFGDLVLAMPDYSIEAVEQILMVYARNPELKWNLGGKVRDHVPEQEIRELILRPALASVFDTPVLRYTSDNQRKVEVKAGEILTGAHYMNAVNRAKKQAAVRRLRNRGVPAVSLEDIRDGLLEESRSAAKTLAADKPMLIQSLRIDIPVVRVELIENDGIDAHRYLRT